MNLKEFINDYEVHILKYLKEHYKERVSLMQFYKDFNMIDDAYNSRIFDLVLESLEGRDGVIKLTKTSIELTSEGVRALWNKGLIEPDDVLNILKTIGKKTVHDAVDEL